MERCSYPPGAPSGDRLGYYTQSFATVELNSSFYHWPRLETFQAWSRGLPNGFQFSVKAPRGLTHAKKLYAPAARVERIAACWHQLVGPTGSFDRKFAVGGEWGCIPILEVLMRPPEVFFRSLSHQEAVRLKRMSTRAEHQSTRMRAAIMLASNVKTPVPQIARMWLTDESHVRKVIHEFNEEGFGSLRPEYRGGRPRRITPAKRKRVVAAAGARPDTQGVPLTRWSLDRLSAYLAEHGVLISPIHLWRLLAEAGLSFQRTRSWKASPDPDYETRAARVLEL